MRVTAAGARRLTFDDGSPVRAASAVARLGNGWLVVQDDATHAAWVRPGSTTRLRVFPPVEGHEVFAASAGTKDLKPDLEAACGVGDGEVLLLGSGSTRARMRVALVTADTVVVHDAAELYADVRDALGVPAGSLNLEGACVVDGRLRWFLRGNRSAGVPSASVDLDLDALLTTVRGGAADVVPGDRHEYDLGEVEGVALAITDAVSLPDGRVLVSAAAEDTPNAVDDGPVAGAALAVLDGAEVVARALFTAPDGEPHKVEGLALRGSDAAGLDLLAVVDDDDELSASVQLDLRVDWD